MYNVIFREGKNRFPRSAYRIEIIHFYNFLSMPCTYNKKCASIHPVNWQAPAIEVTAQPATNRQYIHNSQFKEFEIHLLNTDPKQLEMATKHAERAHERPAYENELKKEKL